MRLDVVDLTWNMPISQQVIIKNLVDGEEKVLWGGEANYSPEWLETAEVDSFEAVANIIYIYVVLEDEEIRELKYLYGEE